MTQRYPGPRPQPLPQHPMQTLIPVLGALIEQSRKREQGAIEALDKQLAGLQQLNSDCARVAQAIRQDPAGLDSLRKQFDSFKAIVDEERAYHQGLLEHEHLVQENLKAWIGALAVIGQPRPMSQPFRRNGSGSLPPQQGPGNPVAGIGGPREIFSGAPPMPQAPQGMRRQQPMPVQGGQRYQAPPQPMRPQEVLAHEPLASVVPPSAFAAYRTKKPAVEVASAPSVERVNGAGTHADTAEVSKSDIVSE